ncbi:MAG: hypothetical protein OQJ89_13385 [Kangiellaceae bacterium]|nr:hypothetical protein [Kangiellaceae bacterium]MCW8997167.1 hypothetical protein [Kangiellaceae bacterium]MCW9017957.1 hypothetical protein [Kangiellaceae bacterium]
MKLVASKLMISTLVVSLSGCVAHLGNENTSKLSKKAAPSDQNQRVVETEQGVEAQIVEEQPSNPIQIVGRETSLAVQLSKVNSDGLEDYDSKPVRGIAYSVSKLVDSPQTITKIGEQSFAFYMHEYELKAKTLTAIFTGNEKFVSLDLKHFLESHEVFASRMVELELEGKSSWHLLEDKNVSVQNGESFELCVSGIAKPLNQIGFMVLKTACQKE